MLTGFIADSFRPIYAEDRAMTIAANVSNGSVMISDTNAAPCSTYDGTNHTVKIGIQNDSISNNCVSVGVNTSNLYGYTMSIKGPDNGRLTNTTVATQVAETKTGTVAVPTTFTTGTATNYWGFAIPKCQLHGTKATDCSGVNSGDLENGFDSSYTLVPNNNKTNTAKYAAVPTVSTDISRTEVANTTDDIYNIYFAAYMSASAQSGTYTGVVTISAVANDAPPIDMQTLTADNCPVERTLARDARDNKTYWVRLIPNTDGNGGDLCWMETNLAYAGGGNNTYQDTMAAIPEGTALDYTTAYRYTPLNANDTSGYHKPVTTTNGASGANNSTANATAQYGYLYNYCAAMGGQTVNDDGTTNGACNSTSAVQPDQKVNPGNGTIYNICPAGWRLPMGGTTAAATNEFAKLNTAINNGSTSSPSGLFTNGLYMYSGGWDNGFNGQGSVGYYSSSTVYNTTVAYGLYFNSASVNLANVGNERYGYAVRCVAPAKEAKTGDDIQTITAKNCPVNRTRVVDARDGKTYWVRKIANTNGLADISADGRQTANGDPLCWMETNLAYAGGGTNTYGDTVTAIPEGTATDYTTAYRYTPLNANPTSGTTDPVTTTNGAAGVNNTTANATAQYGLLYNWCAAMNRQAVACQSAAATQPTQTINTRANQYNICPAGWRLPTGEPTTGEFARLNTAINDGVTNNPSGLFANGLYMYSGYWSNGDFGNQGSSSYYWSSTVGSTANAYALYIISTTGLIPASASNKQAGFAARCVAP